MNTSALALFLNSLEKTGLLNASANEKIQSFLDYRIKSTGKLYLTYAAFTGALFIAAGIGLFFEEFWKTWHQHVRGTLSVFPFLTGLTCYVFTLKRYKHSISLKEAASIFYMLMIGLSLYLFADTYAVNENTDLFVVVWLSVCIATHLISRFIFKNHYYRSTLAVFFYLILICKFIYPSISFTFFIPSGYGLNEYYYLFWIFFFAFLPVFYKTLDFGSKRQGVRAIFLGWVICILLVFVLPIGFKAGYLWWALSILLAFYLTGKKFYADNLTALGRPFQTTALFLLFYNFILVTGDYTRSALFEKDGLQNIATASVEELVSYILGCCTLIVLTVTGIIYRRKNKTLNRYVLFVPILFMLLIGTYYLDEFMPADIMWRNAFTLNWLSLFVLTIYILGFGINAMIQGNKSKNVLYMFYGLALVANLMWAKYSDMDLNFWLKGLFFIGVGCMFFLVHFLSRDEFEESV